MPKLAYAALFGLFAWGVGQFITHMGNNFVANIHGVLGEWDFMSTIDQQTMVLWILFILVLSNVVYVLRRSVVLEEEAEGLV